MRAILPLAWVAAVSSQRGARRRYRPFNWGPSSYAKGGELRTDFGQERGLQER